MMAARRPVFVAYSSRDKTLASLVASAVRKANSKPLPVKYETWEFNDAVGIPLTSPILEKIDLSAFIVADITFLNLNVVYEVGYCIGKRRRAFLVCRSGKESDRDLAKVVGIFDTLGYFSYTDAGQLEDRLIADIDETPLPFEDSVDKSTLTYLVEAPTRTEASAILTSRMKKAGFYRYRTFNADEDSRLSATDALRDVSAAAGVALMLQDPSLVGANVHNVRSMFVAGLADGMSKPLLLLAPKAMDVPADVKDIVVHYQRDRDIHEAVAEFAPKVVSFSGRSEVKDPAPSNLLQSINIGDPRAENEMQTLGDYYLTTPEYHRALGGDVNLVVGRKGSGKTALWIQVRNKTRINKANIVVDLKPDGYQLIKLKEDILLYLTEGARQHLITAFWEYLILLEVAYKLIEKDAQAARFNHDIHDEYLALKAAYQAPDFVNEGDFAERLIVLSSHLSDRYREKFSFSPNQRLSNADVTELLYKHDLKELRKTISNYLDHKQNVWVLFDNLDRGWSTGSADVIDSIVLRCLVDAGRRLEREMRKDKRNFHCIVFVRNDVYDHLMRASADYGKESRATLDWSDADLMREMLRLRLIFKSKWHIDTPFDLIWRELIVSHYHGEETSQCLIERSLMRPRNFLKIFNLCKGFAVSFHRTVITVEDIDKGLRSYSEDLREDLERELQDVFPAAENLLYHFLDAPSVLDSNKLLEIFLEARIDVDDWRLVTNFLIYYGIIGIRTEAGDFFIYDVKYDQNILDVRIARAGAGVKYLIHPAFWPGLAISPPNTQVLDKQQLSLNIVEKDVSGS